MMQDSELMKKILLYIKENFKDIQLDGENIIIEGLEQCNLSDYCKKLYQNKFISNYKLTDGGYVVGGITWEGQEFIGI